MINLLLINEHETALQKDLGQKNKQNYVATEIRNESKDKKNYEKKWQKQNGGKNMHASTFYKGKTEFSIIHWQEVFSFGYKIQALGPM